MTSKPISDNIFVADEAGLPVIIGECPTCRRGIRSLVLVDFVPKARTAASSVYLRCVCCNSIHHKQIQDITEG